MALKKKSKKNKGSKSKKAEEKAKKAREESTDDSASEDEDGEEEVVADSDEEATPDSADEEEETTEDEDGEGEAVADSDDEEDEEEGEGEEGEEGTKLRLPWRERQIKRLTRVEKTLSKLDRIVSASKATGVNADGLTIALSKVQLTIAEISKLEADWKPARGNNGAVGGSPKTKIDVGSTIKIKDKLEGDALKVFKHIPADLFVGAKIIDADGHNWLVKCTDGVTRTIRKRLVSRASV